MRELLYGALAALGQTWDHDQVEQHGTRLGRLLWRFAKERREMATDAIGTHLDLPRHLARDTARRSFEQSGRSFLEIFLNRRVDTRFIRERLTIADPPSWEAMLAEKRPRVVTTGHFGAWELLPAVFEHQLPDLEKQIVVRRPKDEALHRLMKRLRTQPSVEVVEHRQATLKVLRCLKRGGGTAFLVDHNCSTSEAVFLPFLKNIAAVNMGPALLAVRSGALIQPLFLRRDGKGGYVLHTSPPLDTTTLEGSREERIKAAALFYTRAVERMVIAHPEQWFWMHKRWKTQPPTDWKYVPPKS